MKIKLNFRNYNVLSKRGEYYVYVYYDPRPGKDYEPFYVGKGKNDRMWFHLYVNNKKNKTRNRRKQGIIKHILNDGYLPVVEKYISGITEKLAYEIEYSLIIFWGTRKNGDGTLTNIDIFPSEKHRFYEKDKTSTYKKISEKLKKCWQDPNSTFNSIEYRNYLKWRFTGEGNPRYGDHRTWEEIHGREKANKLKDDCSKKYKGKGNPRAKKWILESPEGEKIKVYGNIREKCKELNLSYISLYRFKGNRVYNKKIQKKYKEMSLNTQGWRLYESKDDE